MWKKNQYSCIEYSFEKEKEEDTDGCGGRCVKLWNEQPQHIVVWELRILLQNGENWWGLFNCMRQHFFGSSETTACSTRTGHFKQVMQNISQTGQQKNGYFTSTWEAVVNKHSTKSVQLKRHSPMMKSMKAFSCNAGKTIYWIQNVILGKKKGT